MDSGGYRGAERRHASAAAGETAWFAAGGTLAASLVLAVWLMAATTTRSTTGVAVVAALHGAEVVLAVAVVVTGLAYWRSVGRAHGARLAVVGLALFAVAVLELLAVVGAVAAIGVGIRSALALTAALWFACAVWGPEVDTRLRFGHELLRGAVTVGLLAAVMGLDVVGGDAGAVARTLLVGVAWGGAAVAGLVRAARRGWVLMAWASWAAAGFAASEVARATAAALDPRWAFVSAAMSGAGLLVAAVGGTWVLAVAARTQRSEVHGTLLQGLTMQEQADGRRRELAHEVRNAVFVLEGAVAGLSGANGRRPTEDELRDLQRVVGSGLRMLRQIVSSRPDDGPAGQTFRLDAVVDDCLSAARAREVPVVLAQAPSLAVLGDPAMTSRIVTNLLVNAQRHGGAGVGQPVTVTVGQDADGWAVVRVRDDGPGIPVHLREQVFQPGERVGDDDSGDGVGLSVARDLARRQGGDLRYEAPDAGGACFVLSLPLVDPVGAPGDVDHGLDDRRHALDAS